MEQNESLNSSQKLSNNLGKIGISIMTVGLIILYYDAYRLIQTVSTGYHYYDHPETHIPIIGMIIAFTGITIFIYNFIKGRKVL
jgi:hypothetical protein